MKQIFSGDVYEIIPTANGILFSYKYEKTDSIDQTRVHYKMVSFTTGQFTDVERNIYWLTKFGSNYGLVLKHCENFITVKSLLLAGGKVFLLSPDGKAKLLDLDATPIWQGELLYKGNPPSDIKLCGNALWATYEQSNVLVKFNLTTMRVELRIGNRKEPFGTPKSLFIEDNKAFVCNSTSCELLSVDLNSYTVTSVESFEEPILQYANVDSRRIVILESGLYLL